MVQNSALERKHSLPIENHLSPHHTFPTHRRISGGHKKHISQWYQKTISHFLFPRFSLKINKKKLFFFVGGWGEHTFFENYDVEILIFVFVKHFLSWEQRSDSGIYLVSENFIKHKHFFLARKRKISKMVIGFEYDDKLLHRMTKSQFSFDSSMLLYRPKFKSGPILITFWSSSLENRPYYFANSEVAYIIIYGFIYYLWLIPIIFGFNCCTRMQLLW